MRRRATLRSMILFVIAVLSASAACGGMVVVDESDDPAAGGARPDAGPPSMDASVDAPVKPPPPDAGPDAVSACDDPMVCSRVIDHDGGCIGAASPGDFCDFFATPCASSPPDCDKISAIVGAPAKVASCGNGLSFCDVDWTGTLSAATLDALCAAHAASGQPLDCMLD